MAPQSDHDTDKAARRLEQILAVMRGSGVGPILPNVAALLAIAGVFFAFGSWRLRWE